MFFTFHFDTDVISMKFDTLLKPRRHAHDQVLQSIGGNVAPCLLEVILQLSQVRGRLLFIQALFQYRPKIFDWI